MKFLKNKKFSFSRCDVVKEEIVNNFTIILEAKLDVFQTELKTTMDGIKKNIEEHEEREEKSFKVINKFLYRLDKIILGNGGEGLRTEVTLLKKDNKSLDDDLRYARNKISEIRKETDKKIEDTNRRISNSKKDCDEKIENTNKEVKIVSDRSLITSTKLYMYTGGIAVFITLLGIFVPMLIK